MIPRFFYRKMSLQQIRDDLLETLCDLVVNAGEHHLEPVRLKVAAARTGLRRPSAKLIWLMETLHRYDPFPLNWHAQNLMRAAANEIQMGCYAGTNLSLQPTAAGRPLLCGCGKSVAPFLRWGRMSGSCG